MTPAARSLALLRRAGYTAGVVERFLPRVNLRKDLFGCIDLIAVHRGEAGVLGVQATSAANLASRIKKAQARPELRTWLAAGNRWEAWGWAKRGKRWAVKRVVVHAEELQSGALVALPHRPGGCGHRQRGLFDID